MPNKERLVDLVGLGLARPTGLANLSNIPPPSARPSPTLHHPPAHPWTRCSTSCNAAPPARTPARPANAAPPRRRVAGRTNDVERDRRGLGRRWQLRRSARLRPLTRQRPGDAAEQADGTPRGSDRPSRLAQRPASRNGSTRKTSTTVCNVREITPPTSIRA